MIAIATIKNAILQITLMFFGRLLLQNLCLMYVGQCVKQSNFKLLHVIQDKSIKISRHIKSHVLKVISLVEFCLFADIVGTKKNTTKHFTESQMFCASFSLGF